MKIRDIINHMTKLLADRTGKKVYVEQIGELKGDCLYIEMVSANRKTRTFNIEELTVKLDVKYYQENKFPSNLGIQDMLDNINLAFDRMGIKNIKVMDRYITLQDVNQTIVEGVGHYIFDLNLLVEFGSKPVYELIQILELEVK